jgi:hypothetical protein
MEYGSQILFLLTISYIAQGLLYTSDSFESNIKRGLIGVVLVFLAQSSLKPYKSPFARVRDAFCRVSSRAGLVYIGVLVFLIFQKAEDARYLFSFIDPKLNKELAPRTENYDRSCEFNFDNVMKLSDFYVLAHFVNWFAAALIVRDYYVLHAWSILDEILELSLKSIRPNFAECWWDSLILDLLVANTIGIWLGMVCIRSTNALEYDWLGRKGAKSIKDWKVWTCHRHFSGVSLFFVFVSLNFVTGFTVSNSLWIPPNHRVLILRLIVWFLLGMLGFRETYDDMRTWGNPIRRETNVFAQHRWTAWLLQFSEVAISWKFREQAGNMLDATVPPYVTIPWAIIAALGVVYYIYLRLFYKYRVYKDGTFMDPSIASSVKKNKVK